MDKNKLLKKLKKDGYLPLSENIEILESLFEELWYSIAPDNDNENTCLALAYALEFLNVIHEGDTL